MLCGQRLGLADFWPHSMPRNPRNSNPELCECDFAKVAHSRARPPGFLCLFVRWFFVHRPTSFFRAGIAILARKVTMDNMPVGNFSTAAGAIDLLRPALRGAFSGTGTSIFPSPSFLCHKTRLVRVQRVDRGRTHSNVPSSRAQCHALGEMSAVPQSVCSRDVLASPPRSLLVLAPPVNDRQGRC